MFEQMAEIGIVTLVRARAPTNESLTEFVLAFKDFAWKIHYSTQLARVHFLLQKKKKNHFM